VLSDEASPAEFSVVTSWKEASAENMNYFLSMEKLFHQAKETNKPADFNTDAAWEKLKREINSDQSRNKVFNIQRQFLGNNWLKIAAMVLIATGLGIAVFKLLSPPDFSTVTYASGNKVKELLLTDSTSIVVNRNSTIAYTYTNKVRQIELHGEALFEPANDPDRPFEVKAAGILIRDIGTTFNVKAFDGNDSMIVQVLDGEVIMTSLSNQSMVLKKGEEGLYLKSRDELIRIAIADTNAIAYKTKIFVFENASLGAIVQKLNEVYGITITLSDAIRTCRLTATFKNEKPDAVIEIIAATLQLQIIRDNNTILLDGTVCEE